MGQHLPQAGIMSFEAYAAFLETTSFEQKWELIDGVPVLNPSPVHLHQLVVANILRLLGNAWVAGAPWIATPGVGLRIHGGLPRAPEPDVIVTATVLGRTSVCEDALATFEVVSPDSRDRDLVWKRRAYADVPSLRHYVVVALDEAAVTVFDRAGQFAPRLVRGPGATLALPGLGVELPLAEIYRGVF